MPQQAAEAWDAVKSRGQGAILGTSGRALRANRRRAWVANDGHRQRPQESVAGGLRHVHAPCKVDERIFAHQIGAIMGTIEGEGRHFDRVEENPSRKAHVHHSGGEKRKERERHDDG